MKMIEISKQTYINGIENTQKALLTAMHGGFRLNGVNLRDVTNVNARVVFTDGKFMASEVDAELINGWAKAYVEFENNCLQKSQNVVL